MPTGIQKLKEQRELKEQRDKFVRSIGTRAVRKWPVGTRYNRLVIVGHERQANGCWAVMCRCDCGKDKKVVRPDQMARGLTGSCGCLRVENGQKNKGRAPAGKLEEGEASFNSMLRDYKHNALMREIPFELSDEEFKNVTQHPCAYCGAVPDTTGYNNGKYNGTCIANGIDRVNNAQGYFIGNVVACCKQCNRAKRNLPVDAFLAWIVRVAKHLSI